MVLLKILTLLIPWIIYILTQGYVFDEYFKKHRINKFVTEIIAVFLTILLIQELFENSVIIYGSYIVAFIAALFLTYKSYKSLFYFIGGICVAPMLILILSFFPNSLTALANSLPPTVSKYLENMSDRKEMEKIYEEKLEDERKELEKRYQAKLEDDRRELEKKSQVKLKDERRELEKRYQAKLEKERRELEKRYQVKLEDKRKELEKKSQVKLEKDTREINEKCQAKIETCKLDDDKDGVNNCQDACPNSLGIGDRYGTVGESGCNSYDLFM